MGWILSMPISHRQLLLGFVSFAKRTRVSACVLLLLIAPNFDLTNGVGEFFFFKKIIF